MLAPVITYDDCEGLFSSLYLYDTPRAAELDFWKEAKDLGEKAVKYSEKLLNDAVATASEKILELRHTVTDIVAQTEALRHEVEEEIKKNNLTLEDISGRLSDELTLVFKELETEFSEPLPENKTERYKWRETIVSSAMSKIEDAFVKVAATWEMSEDKARTSFRTISPHVQTVVLVAGKRNSGLAGLSCLPCF
jgi:hypothetical protein